MNDEKENMEKLSNTFCYKTSQSGMFVLTVQIGNRVKMLKGWLTHSVDFKLEKKTRRKDEVKFLNPKLKLKIEKLGETITRSMINIDGVGERIDQLLGAKC